MPVPVPQGLTLQQIRDCERFGKLTGLTPFFDPRPAHHGQHGHNCPMCSIVLVELECRPVRAPVAPRQPWEAKAA